MPAPAQELSVPAWPLSKTVARTPWRSSSRAMARPMRPAPMTSASDSAATLDSKARRGRRRRLALGLETRRGRGGLRHQARLHDQPVGSGADPIGRIAGYQRQLGIARAVEHRSVAGLEDPAGGDLVAKLAPGAPQKHPIARLQFVDMAKECVAMAGDHDIAGH